MRRVERIAGALIGIGVAAAGIGITTSHRAASRGAEHRPGRRMAKHLAVAEPGRDRALLAYANLPLAFVENRGQIDKRVLYSAQRGGFAAHFTSEQVVYSLGRDQASRSAVVALRFLQANRGVSVEAEERAPGEVSYFRGNDASRWQTALPQYSRLVYHELWAGVDLRLQGHAKAMKYEFRVRPGVPVSTIRLAYRGASGISLDGAGGLRIDTPAGVLRDAAPVSYQEIDGARVPVESRYVLKEDGEYGFATGAGYRKDRELIIDPALDYSTFLGGAGADSGARIAVDAAGNAYIVGITQSSDFPTTAGAFRRTGAVSGFTDVFVSKLNPTGTALIYSTFIGGSDLDWGRAIAIDAAGNAYIAGQTKSSDFPTTAGAFDRTFNIPNCPRCGVDNYDAFVAKLNPSGSALVYSTFLGGASDIDDALGIAVDSSGSAYVTGETASADFPVTAGAFRTVRNGADDAYVTKLNPAGSALVYSTFIGGSAVDFGVRIAVDAFHNAYVVGNTSSVDFPTTPGAFDTTQNGSFDLFVLELNATGSGLIFSTFLGGSNMELAGGLALDSAGNVYVSGGTISLDFPTTPGAFRTVTDGNDGFVTKLNPTGSALVYSTFIGGSGSDGVSGMALDASGNVFLTGTTGSQDFPTTVGAVDSTYNGGVVDAYVAELSADGSTLLYGTYLGGGDSDNANDLALGPAGSVYVTGQTMSTDFPTTPGAFDQIRNGPPQVSSQDAFVAKLTPVSGPLNPAALSSVSVNPASVTGGNPSAGTIALTAPAPAGGAVATLSSNSAAASVPASVTIAQGSSGTFPIATSAVASTITATITATYNGVAKTATLTLAAPPPPVSLQSVAIFPSSVTGGSPAQATVILTGPTPTSFGVTITGSGPLTLPSAVTVQAGSNTVNFTVNTQTVTSATTGVITATSNADGVSKSVGLSVNPVAQTDTLTVTATGRSGQVVSSTPAGISVATGSSGSGAFNPGTSITLSVSNSRSAIWSGACSSGGRSARSCTFTINANAAVTANVQ
jgi:hypothetical protein